MHRHLYLILILFLWPITDILYIYISLLFSHRGKKQSHTDFIAASVKIHSPLLHHCLCHMTNFLSLPPETNGSKMEINIGFIHGTDTDVSADMLCFYKYEATTSSHHCGWTIKIILQAIQKKQTGPNKISADEIA